MSDDPPPGIVETLDEWDDDQRPPRTGRRAWWIGPLVLVAIVAIVVAVVVGGTKRPEVAPTPSTVAPTARVTSADPAPTSWATVDATVASSSIDVYEYTPEPLSADAEAEPLLVTLVDPKPRTSPGTVAYNVQVCVSKTSASRTGGKVRVSRSGWMLAGTSDSVPPLASGSASDFPETTMLGPGQCASGWVTFPLGSGQTYSAIFYGDERFGWSWRLE